MPAKWQQWMPFYIDRFLGSFDVQNMEPAAFKAYVRLLLYAWQTDDCTVLSDPDALASYSGIGKRLWDKHGASVLRKFTTVTVTVGDTVTERLRNAVQFELWSEAKRIHEARKTAAMGTNATRSPRRSPSRSAAHNNNPLQEQEQKQGTRGEAPPTLDTVTVTFDPDDGLIPEGLSTLQYAAYVLENASIAAGFQLRNKLSDAIALLARSESVSLPRATALMLERVQAAQARGETVNGFWIEDGKWKAQQAKTARSDAFDSVRSEFLAGGD